ncbi:hypothetical protein GN956_G26416 [Arapaima gigas]
MPEEPDSTGTTTSGAVSRVEAEEAALSKTGTEITEEEEAVSLADHLIIGRRTVHMVTNASKAVGPKGPPGQLPHKAWGNHRMMQGESDESLIIDEAQAKFFENRRDESWKQDFLSQGWPEEEVHLDYLYKSEARTAASASLSLDLV